MEQAIEKKICLNDFKGRMGTFIPSYNDGMKSDIRYQDYNDWGKLPYDIVISDMSGGVESVSFSILPGDILYDYATLSGASENLPLFLEKYTNSDRRRLLLRYGTMSDAYAQLMDFMRTCTYYRLCKRNSSRTGYNWVEMTEYTFNELFEVQKDIDGKENKNYNVDRFYCTDWVILSELPTPTIETYYGNVYICINETDKVNNFNKRFTDKYGNRYDKIFYNLVREFFDAKYGEASSFLGVPSIYLPLSIDADEMDFGRYSPYYVEWEAGKRYFTGTVVHYTAVDDEIETGYYRLIRGEGSTAVEIPKSVYDANKDDYPMYWEHYAENGYYIDLVKKYLFIKPYYEGYVHNGVVRFDSITDGVLDHWEKLTSSTMDGMIEGVGTSFLSDMMRKKKDIDDEGNELPFVFDENCTNNGELRYIYDEEFDGNYMREIKFVNDLCESVTPTDNPPKCIDENVPDNYKYIKFEYYTNPTFYSHTPATINLLSGVVHREVYKFKRVNRPFHTNGANYGYGWVTSDMISGNTPDFMVEEMPYPSKDNYDKMFMYTSGGTEYQYYAYDMDTEKYVGFVSGMTYTCYPFVSYIDIDYGTSYEMDFENSRLLIDESPMSHLYIFTKHDDNMQIDGLTIFHNSEEDSIFDVDSNIDARVSRGEYAAFERHNTLGEVNTFEDLEQFRNGMYGLKSQK